MILKIMEFCSTDTIHNFIEAYPIYTDMFDNKRLWVEVETKMKYPSGKFMTLFMKHAAVTQRLRCKFRHELLCYPKLNTAILPQMTNLVSLNLQKCGVLYNAFFLEYMPHLRYLNVSKCPWVSTRSLIDGVQCLKELQFFWCNYNTARVSSYSIMQMVEKNPKLELLSCLQSGRMSPYLTHRILRKCPEMRKFNFTSDFHNDCDTTRLQWYNIVRRKYPHVEFNEQTYLAVRNSENESEVVKGAVLYDAMRKYIRELN